MVGPPVRVPAGAQSLSVPVEGAPVRVLARVQSLSVPAEGARVQSPAGVPAQALLAVAPLRAVPQKTPAQMIDLLLSRLSGLSLSGSLEGCWLCCGDGTSGFAARCLRFCRL